MRFKMDGSKIFVSCLLALVPSAAWTQTPAQQVAAVLDDWHQAASVADEARYFGHFAPNGVFIGTDPSPGFNTVSRNVERSDPSTALSATSPSPSAKCGSPV